MALASQASGSQLTVIGTEHSLATIAVAGTFILEVDLSVMAAGDCVEIRWKSKTLTGGTERNGDIYYRDGGQPVDKLQFVSDFVPNLNTDSSSVEFSLKQTIGSVRTFAWQIFKYS